MRIGKRKSKVAGQQSAVESLTHSASWGRGVGASTYGRHFWSRRFGGSAAGGFTLLELMIVLVLILIMASIVVPTYHIATVRAREAVLKDDLYTMRKLIDQYTVDKQEPPQSLDDLVEAKYLRGGIPVDPFTGSNQTWVPDTEDVPVGPQQTVNGIVDVHSGSDETSLDGTPYSSW